MFAGFISLLIHKGSDDQNHLQKYFKKWGHNLGPAGITLFQCLILL